MATKKKKPTKNKPPAFKIELNKRKKPGSRNATSFQPGNPHRFAPGTSGNVGGKPKNYKLLSRTIRSMLSDPAPHALCRAIGVKVGSSWSTCIAHRLVMMSAVGDLDATRLLATLTEGMNSRGGLDLAFDDLQRDPGSVPPIFRICLVESDGDGRPKEGQSFDGVPFSLEKAVSGPLPALPAATD